MSRFQVRLLSAVIVAAVVVTAFLTKGYLDRRRSTAIESFEVAAGTSKTEVVRLLGQPEQELSGPDLASHAGNSCAPHAGSMFGYTAFTFGSDGGPYLDVYFDTHDRVICVEHGLMEL